MENKATIEAVESTKFNRKHRKENACHLAGYSVIDMCGQETEYGKYAPEVISLRIYYPAKGSTATACLWIYAPSNELFPDGLYRNGSGSAGGYGYCKKSAAAQEAISNAGIELEKRIDGVGESAIEGALLAIAEACGVKRPALIKFHP